jgi:hypothetical protein
VARGSIGFSIVRKRWIGARHPRVHERLGDIEVGGVGAPCGELENLRIAGGEATGEGVKHHAVEDGDADRHDMDPSLEEQEEDGAGLEEQERRSDPSQEDGTIEGRMEWVVIEHDV